MTGHVTVYDNINSQSMAKNEMSYDIGDDLYARLTRPFEVTYWGRQGGAILECVIGKQVTSHLNRELEFVNWTFRITEHGTSNEAAEA